MAPSPGFIDYSGRDRYQTLTGGLSVVYPSDILGAPPVALPLIETWTVANAFGTMDGDRPWAEYIGSPTAYRVENQTVILENAGGLTHGGRLDVQITDGDDYRVLGQIEEWAPAASGLLVAGVCGRMQGDTSITFYAAALVTFNSASTVVLQRWVAGSEVDLAVRSVVAHPNAQLGLGLRGNRISALYDGATVLSVVNSEIPTGRYVGLQGVANAGHRFSLTSLAARAFATAPHDLFTLRPLMGVR